MAVIQDIAALAVRASGPELVGLEACQTWTLLAQRRAAWAAVMGDPGDFVGLRLDNGFEFAAALLGAWNAGVGVVLPGDATPLTLSALRSRTQRLFIGDEAIPSTPVAPASVRSDSTMPDVPIVVFTSGSTGDPVAIPKSLRCIQNELYALESIFGESVKGAAFLSTVSHQHYYGLLFKILWPLSTGRPFSSKQLSLPGEIATAAELGRCVLVSSPALLKRVGTTPEAIEVMAPVRASLAAVFSSGGPLPWDAVRRCTRALNCCPTEVYGSSETGGIAWRLRTRETDPWMPLPGVEVAIGDNRRLRLRSNHVEELGWVESDDLAVPAEGGFHLLGRADQIVKIEEKRVSLAALERRLVEHPRVSEARVLLLKGARDILGAVVRLNDSACMDAKNRAPLTTEDRRALADTLRLHLKNVSDPTVLPRQWRFVDELPLDSMGKITQAVLEALFIGKEVREAECLHIQRLDMGVELHLFLPDALLWFRGHFPGRPLLPGVVQVHWAILAARKHLDLNGPFQGFRALKFTRPLRPRMRVNLTLTPSPDGFEFSYISEEGRHAVGHVLLA